MVSHLLKIENGETEEQALKRWWIENGLDYEATRVKRKETYAQQLKQAMEIVDAFKLKGMDKSSDSNRD